MSDGRKKITDLSTVSDSLVDGNTLMEIAAENGGSWSSFKSTLSAIFDKILRSVAFTQRLNTNNKTVFGAINELQAGGGGSSTLEGLSDVTVTSPQGGQSIIYDIANNIWKNGLPAVRMDFTIQGDVGDGGCYLIGDIDDWLMVNNQTKEMLLLGSDTDGNVYTFPWFGNYKDLSDTTLNCMMFGRIHINSAGQTVVQTAKVTDSALYPNTRMDIEWEEHIVPMSKEVSGTLTAGSTSITLSDAAITTSSTIDIYTDTYGVNPTAVTVSTGSVAMTFESQASNVSVKVRVS